MIWLSFILALSFPKSSFKYLQRMKIISSDSSGKVDHIPVKKQHVIGLVILNLFSILKNDVVGREENNVYQDQEDFN